MARYEDRIDDNVPGDCFVDRSCIDCDLCRQLLPGHGRRFVARDHAAMRAELLRLAAAM